MTRIACVFPGQGSQTVGMLSELATEYKVVEETFALASEALGYDLWQLVQHDEDGKLNETHVTQPALLAASVAIWNILSENGINVDYMAGHSLGEYSALVCAGVIPFEEAIKLVESRGKYMQKAVPAGTGAMYAIIGLDDEAIANACAQAADQTGSVVAPVNFNSPGQVVIAGEKAATELAGNLCKEAGAKRALPLPVSVPSHCELMRPAAVSLEETLSTISLNTPKVDVINNVDVKIESDEEAIRDALVRQLYCPVQWTNTVKQLAELGVERIIEVGPGKVLTGLIKRIDKSLTASAVNTLDGVSEILSEIKQ